MATEAAWLNRKEIMERRKQTPKCALTSTGLLIEGPDRFHASFCYDFARLQRVKIATILFCNEILASQDESIG
jgi:hypothetical protein